MAYILFDLVIYRQHGPVMEACERGTFFSIKGMRKVFRSLRNEIERPNFEKKDSFKKEMITYKYRDAFPNYYYTIGGSSSSTYSSTQVTQQSKFKVLLNSKKVIFLSLKTMQEY